MVYFLTNLDNRIPGILCFNLATIRTLLASNDNFKDIGLLKDGRGKDFLLYSKFNLDPFTVRFSP